MRRKMVWRYYCDFCKKAGCSGGHIKTHEAHCTMNPGRVCRMCQGLPKHWDLAELVLVALDRHPSVDPAHDGQEIVNRLMDLAGGCPACVLAAIRQADLATTRFDCDTSPGGENQSVLASEGLPFDYEVEKKKFWADQQRREHDDEMRYHGAAYI